jgi:RNA polymerase sigma factor, sigma-70 family
MKDQAVHADAVSVDYAGILELIRAGDPKGEENLYRIFARSFRFLLARNIPAEDVDDQVQEVFMALIQAVRRGSPRDAAALPAFAQTILRRSIANIYRGRAMRIRVEVDSPAFEIADGTLNSLELILRQEQIQELERALAGLSPEERDVITRFYMREEPPKEIRGSMGLTDTQFYVLKTRGRKKLLAALRKPPDRIEHLRREHVG